jgi:rod shape-determining protein MreD
MYYFKWPLLFVVCFILQTSFVPSIAVFGVKPDLLMVLLFFFSIRYGSLPGLLVGFSLGLAQDLYAPALLGQTALAKTIIGACSGLFNEKIMRTDAFVKAIILFLMFLVHDSIFSIILLMKNAHHLTALFPELALRTVPRAFYSVIIAALFYVWEMFSKVGKRS